MTFWVGCGLNPPTVDVGLREGVMEDWGTVKWDVLLLNVVRVLALVDE